MCMLAMMVTSAGFLAVTQNAFPPLWLKDYSAFVKNILPLFIFLLLPRTFSQAQCPSAVCVFT